MTETSSRSNDERRGSMCPDCPGVRGVARSTSVGGGIVTVTYKCPACDRMWEDSRPEKKLTAIN